MRNRKDVIGDLRGVKRKRIFSAGNGALRDLCFTIEIVPIEADLLGTSDGSDNSSRRRKRGLYSRLMSR